MPISKPQLPPKFGYVEVVDENGKHVYEPTPETEEKLRQEEKVKDSQKTIDTLFDTSSHHDELTAAGEFRLAIQMFAATIADESKMLAITSVYPVYSVGVKYHTKDVFRYGTNAVGDPQLYQVLQDHMSAAEHTPDTAVSLYKKIGVAHDGTPEWVQPLGATDSYSEGDVVMHDGKKWISTTNNNVWEPGVQGWDELVDEQ